MATSTVKRVTIEDFDYTRAAVSNAGAGYPIEIAVDGTQVLVQRASIAGANLYSYSTGGRVTGPVFLNSSGTGSHNRAEPHMRWATGVLRTYKAHVVDTRIRPRRRGTLQADRRRRDQKL